MNDINIKVEIMAKDIQFLKDEIVEIKNLIKDHSAEERETWEKLLSTKANAWVETVIKTLIGVVLLSFVGGLVYLVWHVTPIIGN